MAPLAHNFLDLKTSIETVLTGLVWKVICMHLNFEDAGLELLQEAASDSPPLAHVGLRRSSFTYESMSDGCRLVDFVASDIFVEDVSRGPKAATNVLANLVSSRLASSLQLELHFRSRPPSSAAAAGNRVSILISNSRLLALPEWLVRVGHFFAPIEETTRGGGSADQACLQLKLNVLSSDFLIVQDAAQRDSHALGNEESITRKITLRLGGNFTPLIFAFRSRSSPFEL